MSEEIKGQIRRVTRTFGKWVVLGVYVDPKILKGRVFEGKKLKFKDMRKHLKNKPVYVGINPIHIEEKQKVPEKEKKKLEKQFKKQMKKT